MKRIFLEVQPLCWMIAVFGMVVLPFKWVIAWVFAVTFHELGHYIALKALRIPVHFVSIKLTGAYMHTAPMTVRQEMLVAAMGPVFSLLLVLFSQWMPYTACCAFFQLLFNLLPLVPFDGGRILWNVLRAVLSETHARTAMGCLRYVLLIAMGVIAVYMGWGSLLILAITLLLARWTCVTFPCKAGKQIVQWSKCFKRGNSNERTAPKDPAYSAEACPLHRRRI